MFYTKFQGIFCQTNVWKTTVTRDALHTLGKRIGGLGNGKLTLLTGLIFLLTDNKRLTWEHITFYQNFKGETFTKMVLVAKA